MTHPPSDVWSLVGTDEDIIEDLRALGVTVGPESFGDTDDQTRRDAVASALLRLEATELEGIAQAERSRDLELEFINHRYGAEISRRADRVEQLAEAIKAIAYQTKEAGGYVGKKKSRDVGAGTFGYRSYAAGLELRDDEAFRAWAETHAPNVLRVKPTMTLAEARQYLTETELAGVRREVIKADAADVASKSDELPPGFVRVDASDDFYAKPLPAAALP